MTTDPSRRSLIAATIAAMPVYALLSVLSPAVLARDSRSAAGRWIRRHDELARSLADGRITDTEWQAAVEDLSAAVDPVQLAAEIDRARPRTLGRGLPSDPVKQSVAFLDDTGARRRLRFAAALFRFERENVITPHAHRHMVSSHLVLDGAFRVRTFDRIADEDDALIVRPTGDIELETGGVSTMSDERDNIHWFVPLRARSVTFDVIVSGLDAGHPDFRIEAVDPLNSQTRPDGSIRAPLIGFAEAARHYTADL